MAHFQTDVPQRVEDLLNKVFGFVWNPLFEEKKNIHIGVQTLLSSTITSESDDRIGVLDNVLQPVGDGVLREARRYVDELSAEGYTDLEGALQTGLTILSRSEARGATRMVVFLTDGLPTAGITDDVLIAESIAQANAETTYRLHVFGVGYDVNTHLLDRLAADNGGTITYVQPGENLEAVLTGFYGQIAHPVLTDLAIEYEGMTVSELHPKALPDLFHGSNLFLA